MNISKHLTIRTSTPSIYFDQASNVRRDAVNPQASRTQVTISPEARRLSQSSNSGLDLATLDRVKTIDKLKDALKEADFRNMSARESASVASALDRTGQFDIQATANFFISMNTDKPANPDTKVDLVECFAFMLDNAKEGAKTDADFAPAVKIREKGSDLLDTLMSWGLAGHNS